MDVPILLAMIALVAFSGFFSASETAFLTANRARLKTMAQDKNKGAARALKLLDDYPKLISSILVGNNLVNILLSSLATVFFIQILQSESMGTMVSTIVSTIFVLIFGEVSPKTLAKEAPEAIVTKVSFPLSILCKILTPINFLFTQWNKLLLRLFKVKGTQTYTEDDLLSIVDEAETGGGIDEEKGEFIRSAIEFNDLDVHDVLTPRVDVVAVDLNDSTEAIRNTFKESGFSRLPVYNDTIDNIEGVINQKDFYEQVVLSGKNLSSILAPAKCVTPYMKISDLMKELQKSKSHMAIVVDEYGGTYGIITLEDIIEELVGEIWDEHDEVVEEFLPIGENTYHIDGTLSPLKFFDEIEFNDEYEDDLPATMAGFVMKLTESVPNEGEEIQYQNLLIKVLTIENSRIEKLQVQVLPKAESSLETDEKE